MVDTALLLEMVSRTFALSIRYLPDRIQETVALAYLLFRVSDCMEDYAGFDSTRKIQLLTEWEEVLLGNGVASVFVDHISDMDANDPEVHVARQAPELMTMLDELPIELREKIVRHVVETTAGMAKWQQKGPLVNDVAELDDYMYYVAGLVGYLITEIFSWYSTRIGQRKARLMPLSRHSGLGLQTVNIIRGLRKDYERGWVFVPRSLLASHGLTAADLFAIENEEQALRVVGQLADKAEIHLRFGLDYVKMIPHTCHRIRLACMWPLFFAVRTLALSRNNLNVIRDEVKISRDEVASIMRQTFLFGWSNTWLHHYFYHLQQPPQLVPR